MSGIVALWIIINITGFLVSIGITKEAHKDYKFVRDHHATDTYEYVLGREHYLQGLLKSFVLFMLTAVGFMAIMPSYIRQHISIVLILAALVLTLMVIRDRLTMNKLNELP